MPTIGNTPLIRLSRLAEPGCADIYVKYEGSNPTGSMKDRMALSTPWLARSWPNSAHSMNSSWA